MNRVGVKPSSLLSAQLPLFSYPDIPSNIILPSTSNILYKSNSKHPISDENSYSEHSQIR